MKIAIWCLFGLLAVLWTASAWVAAELTQWASQLVASGAVADFGQAAGRWPVPAWLAPWIDSNWIQALQGVALGSLEALRDSLPFVGSALGWLVPVVWLVWGMGTVALLGLTALALWLSGLAGSSFRPRLEGLRA